MNLQAHFVELHPKTYQAKIKSYFDGKLGSEIEYRICTLHEWGAIVTACCCETPWINFFYQGKEYQTKFLETDLETTIKNSIEL
ncbi:MAG: hypothetical protein Unbinned5930contig1000_10 [Prokaryotic dsDNA virus sp.]|nr:MAG: hypothetical protein Unbinned5930contig1000_10 [Prokaryotic dsDNA virus sp.]|tara:strand:+ start:3018 stop:3269 length:252 start_codon:yes stop_codon:yes gene_type:complete